MNLFIYSGDLVQLKIDVTLNFILSLFKVMLLSGKDKGKTGTVTEVVRSKNWVFVEGLNTVRKLVSKWDVWGLEAGFHNNYIVGVIIVEGLNVKLLCVAIWSWKYKLLRMSWIFAWSFYLKIFSLFCLILPWGKVYAKNQGLPVTFFWRSCVKWVTTETLFLLQQRR